MDSATTVIGKIKSNVKTKPKAKKQTFNRTIIIKLSAVVLVLALLSVGTWRIAKATEGKILPKVMIAGIKVGGKTPTQAKKIVQSYIDQINTQGPEITYDTQSINPKLSDLGMTFNADKAVDEAYNFGRHGSWQNRVKENSKMMVKNYNIELTPVVEENKLDEYLGQVAQVVEVAPQNASLSVTNGNISLSPSKIGRGLDKEKLKKDITTLINENKLTSQITLVTSELEPNIKEKDTIQAQEKANKYMNSAPILVTFESDTYTADKGEVGSWISFAESGHTLVADVSASKVGGFTGAIASRIEIPKIDKEIMEGTGEVLVEGQDGRGVDTGRLTSEVYNRTISCQTGPAIAVGVYPIPKGEVTKNPHAQPGRYAGRYIDINLSEQTLYAFEGNNLVNQFLVSAGLTGPTPTGEFSVYSKSRSTLMDGPGYYLPNVEWVSWFTGDYSIHGTYWHNNFGHPMSHGCVNASNGDAEWLYGWDDVGTPVYIHW